MYRAVIALFVAAAPLYSQPFAAMRQLYASRCAGCHGDAMQGGRAPSLADDTWTNGGTEDAILATIRDGSADAGMPAFKESLSDVEMRGLLLLIRTQATQAAGRPATRATPMTGGVIRSEALSFSLEPVTGGIETPWAIGFFPDGRMLISERPGRLRIFSEGKLFEPVRGTPAPWVRQDGGYFDVEIHPNYAENGWVYLAYSEGRGEVLSMTTIVRGRIRDNTWTDEQVLYRAPDELFTARNFHYGLRFIFDREGYLYYSIGDHGDPPAAQDLSSPLGKIHRIHDDGRIPADNPFAGREGALGSIWTYGHRNPQGFSFHPETGALWATEHGPTGGDEVNIIVKGHNYGWPVVSYGLMDNGLPTPATTQAGMDDPVTHWEPSPGICPILVYNGDHYPGWKGSVLAGAMGHEELKRLAVDGARVVSEEVVFKGHGRVRDIVLGPDGFIYLALAEPGPQLSSTTSGRIVRIMPAP